MFSWSCTRLRSEAFAPFRLLGRHPGRDFDVPAAAALAGCSLADAAHRAALLTQTNLVLGLARRLSGNHAGAREAHCDALSVAREHGYRLDEARALEGPGGVGDRCCRGGAETPASGARRAGRRTAQK